jgi:hypothetical protein
MNNWIEHLLKPISADLPCGPDLSYDPRLNEIEDLLKGKPAVEFGPVVSDAEPPDWLALKARALHFLTESKHLQVAVVLTCALNTMPFSRSASRMRSASAKFFALRAALRASIPRAISTTSTAGFDLSLS